MFWVVGGAAIVGVIAAANSGDDDEDEEIRRENKRRKREAEEAIRRQAEAARKRRKEEERAREQVRYAARKRQACHDAAQELEALFADELVAPYMTQEDKVQFEKIGNADCMDDPARLLRSAGSNIESRIEAKIAESIREEEKKLQEIDKVLQEVTRLQLMKG